MDNAHPERKQGSGRKTLTTQTAKPVVMPDIIKAKKISDFCAWVHYDNPDINVKADIVGIKFSESERKRIAAQFSPQQVGGEYEKELKGNNWETFVFTKSSGMLPMETWKQIASQGFTTASGGHVPPSNISGNIVTYSERFAFNLETALRCAKCQQDIFQPNAIFCPICGERLSYVPQSNTKTLNSGVP